MLDGQRPHENCVPWPSHYSATWTWCRAGRPCSPSEAIRPAAAALLAFAGRAYLGMCALHAEPLLGTQAHLQGGGTILPWLMSQLSYARTTTLLPAVLQVDLAGLSPAQPMVPPSYRVWPLQLPHLMCLPMCEHSCVAAGLLCWLVLPQGCPGDACEPANSCMRFASRLGGSFAQIHAHPPLVCTAFRVVPVHMLLCMAIYGG